MTNAKPYCIIEKPLREWRNRQTRTFEGRVSSMYGFKSRLPHQIRTQNRIQLFVPILRFLLPFRGIFALSRHKKHIFDRRSPSSESFCTFGGWAFLFALNLWVIVKIMVIVKIIVYGRYLVLKMCLFYAII